MFLSLDRMGNLLRIVCPSTTSTSKKIIGIIKSSFIFFGLLPLIGCTYTANTAENTVIIDRATTKISSNFNIKNNLTKRFAFQREDGRTAFYLRPRANGAKLEREQGGTIVNLILSFQGKIDLQTSAGLILGHVLGREDRWQIEDGEETKILYTLHQDDDGNYKLVSGKQGEIYYIKQQDYGLEILTSQEESIYKVTTENNRNILQSANGQIILSTDADFPLLAMACYGFELLDRNQQSGLAYAVSLTAK